MKRKLIAIISFFLILAQSFIFAENNKTSDYSKTEVSIKFYDRTMYYPGKAEDNPIYVHITIANKGTENLYFKLADDRMFSMDFTAFTVKNTQLPQTQTLVRKRTVNSTIYFREISIAPGEEYSFVENVKEYLDITEPSIYYLELNFYPELYKEKQISISSNRLSLEIRPSPSAASSNFISVQDTTVALLQPEPISPDHVVEQTIIARQRNLWDQYFLYMDLEEMLKRDPVRLRKYNNMGAEDRNEMLRSFKAQLMQDRIDKDIVAIPSDFSIDITTYSRTEGTVKVYEWFKNKTYTEKKRYTYYLRQRDGIWQIYDYSVENLENE